MPRIKASLEDFRVDEIPAYEPEGSGEHLFVRFEKRGRNTDDVVREIARAVGVSPRDVGVAGLKDKVGVTTQTISLQAPRGATRAELEARALSLAIDGVKLLDAKWHKNKLKTGHLRGNRFDILVRDVADDSADALVAAFEDIGRVGVPNHFGPQRFGIGGRNVERAIAWLSGKDRGPRDPKARRFSFSVWQSAIFNRVLDKRLADETWSTAVLGDLMQKHGSGGLFVCADVETDRERARALEISATGPMIGDKMRWPEGAIRELEQAVVHEALGELGIAGETDFFARNASLGEGTRRPLRQIVGELKAFREHGGAVRVQFVLPSGAYATTVLSRAVPGLVDASAHAPEGEPDAPDAGEERTEPS